LGHAEQLAECVEEQCIDVLARVIAAEHGTFIYSKGVRLPARTEVVPLNADRVMVEATKRTDELATLRSLLPSSRAPLVLGPDLELVAETLTDAEVLVAATLLAGAGSLAELADKVAMDELALWRTVISLRERGLLIAGQPELTSGAPSPIDDPSDGAAEGLLPDTADESPSPGDSQ
jgi:hypothetical protein